MFGLENLVRWVRKMNRMRLARRRVASSVLPHHVMAVAAPMMRLPVPVDARIDPAAITLHTSDKPLVSIVIPAYGKVDVTLRCLAALQRNPPRRPYEVLVVEDASGEPDAALPGQVKGVRFLQQTVNLGFLRTCNAAVSLTCAPHVLLLNNDTQVLDGAIDALRDTFDQFPEAGLVGAKLVYPDGRLQEAGGIVWRDGSARNHGRLGDPDAAAYQHVRDVDYISGAAIMLDTALWRRLGGFDERFCPAYYEDTDLAMQVRHARRRVIYQPAATVVHLEGVSSGTDETQGVKRHQTINARFFREKWKAELDRSHFPPRDDNILLACERVACKRMVLVTNDLVIRPDNDAGSRAVLHSIQALLSLGCQVKYWPENPGDIADGAAVLRRLGVEVIIGPQRPDFDDWVRAYGPHLVCAFLHRPEPSGRYIPGLRAHSTARLVYVGHDLHFQRLAAQAELQDSARLWAAADAMQALESSIWRKVDASVYFSHDEVSTVRALNPRLDVRMVPAYCFAPTTAPTQATPGLDICFVAGFGHPPNVDAAVWLVQHIMPKVWEREPGARLQLVGSRPTPEVLALAGERVEVTGWVSDDELARRYRQARVAVVPLRFGAGVKHKVLEALAAGVPLVTTVVGAQGLPGLSKACQVVDDMAMLPDEILTLLHDDAVWLARVQGAARYMNSQHSAEHLREATAGLLPGEAAPQALALEAQTA